MELLVVIGVLFVLTAVVMIVAAVRMCRASAPKVKQ
jgi:hypothetical protein